MAPLPCLVGRLRETLDVLVGRRTGPLACGKLGTVGRIAQKNPMNARLEVLEAEALKLAPAERTHLLERLIASLDTDPETEALWDQETDRREAASASGAVSLVPGHEAIARLQAKLAR